MKYKLDGYNWLVRLDRGEKLIANLSKLVKEQNINSAWISGLGAAQESELGFYDLDNKKYIYRTFDKLLEITSLQGNIAWKDSELVIHIHGTFSDQDMRAYGGHVKELIVGGTCEILLHRWYGDKLKRKLNDQTGLNEIQL
jgi:uncharacterized protein